MSWAGTHPFVDKKTARALLPPRACRGTVHFVRVFLRKAVSVYVGGMTRSQFAGVFLRFSRDDGRGGELPPATVFCKRCGATVDWYEIVQQHLRDVVGGV